MKVMVMMSGGVDSSVAAALVRDSGAEAVGVTLKLWGGESDTGCCSISDVDDARRVADRLGIDHHTFNFADQFTRDVVDPYVQAHAEGRTPNPCIECNRHLKFDEVYRRAMALGFDAVATGHHARVVETESGALRIGRGVDPSKDQSYVLHMLGPDVLARTQLPIGSMTKDDVRRMAADLGLRTASKPDSQDVCFITRREGRGQFLQRRIPLTPAPVFDRFGDEVGRVDAVEMVTVGQRRGLGLPGGTAPRYVVDVRTGAEPRVVVGEPRDLLVAEQPLANWSWVGQPDPGLLDVQVSAHGKTERAVVTVVDGAPVLRWEAPHRLVAAGQSVVAYLGDLVIGSGTAGSQRD